MESEGDVFDGFHKSTQEDKIEAFEASTLALVLRQIGMPVPRAKGIQRELGEGFTFNWFNGRQYLEFDVESTRIFRFNFMDLFFTPGKSPLVEHFLKERGRYDGPFALIFRVYSAGRVVATSFAPPAGSVLHIRIRGVDIYFSPFAGFFTNYPGDFQE